MNICFVSSHRLKDLQHLNFLGNIPVRMSTLLDGDATIHLLYNGEKKSRQLFEKGIHLHPYGRKNEGWFANVINLFITPYEVYRICKNEKVDIVINLSDHYSFFLSCIGGRIAKCKCVVRVVGILPYSRLHPWKKKIKKRVGMVLEKFTLWLSNHAICLSESIYETLLDRGNNPKKLSVISQGIDTIIFQSKSIENIKQTPNRFVFVGRLVPTKGVEDCIRAFLKVVKEYPEKKMLIYGDGPEKERLESLYGNEVIFNGFIPLEELIKVYQESDVLILPSYSEGLPNVVLEAMVSRVPVIASNVGGTRELLGQGRGLLVSPGNIEEIAGAMKQMIENQELRVSCTEKAFQYVTKYHSFEAVRESTVVLFEKCLAK